MPTPVLLTPETRWSCPNCPATDVTREANPHVRMHTCPGLKGITAPMVHAGTKAKVYARERDDYLNGDQPPMVDADGRVVMSVVTERDDGQDCTVFVPTAVARLSEFDTRELVERLELPTSVAKVARRKALDPTHPLGLMARFRQKVRRQS